MVPLLFSVPSALLTDPKKQREAVVGPAVATITRSVSPDAHPGQGSGGAAHSQVGKEIRPISLATERVEPVAGRNKTARTTQGTYAESLRTSSAFTTEQALKKASMPPRCQELPNRCHVMDPLIWWE